MKGDMTLISVIKMGDCGCDRSVREFRISAEGLSIGDNFPDAESLLVGLAHFRSPGSP